MSLKSQDFREELGVHHAADHLAAEAVVDGMTLQKGHCEAPQPTEIVAQRSLTRTTVVLAKVDVQDPVHRLAPLIDAYRLADTPAAVLTAENVDTSLIR